MARREKKKPKQNKPKRNAKQGSSWPPLLVELMRYAIQSPTRARDLVRKHPEVLDLRTGLGETALHYFAVENQAEAMKVLIDLGAKVDVNNDFGDSALQEALQVNATAAVEVLRRAGATEPTVPEPLDYPDEPE